MAAATWESVTVDGGEMPVYVALPDGGGPAPGVVVVHYAGGVDAFVQSIVERFAGDGLAAIAPSLFHRDANSQDSGMDRMMRLPVGQFVRDLAAARAHLGSRPGGRVGGIGVTGIGIGGPVAWLAAAGDEGFGAAVVFYPGRMTEPWAGGPSPLAAAAALRCPVLGLFGDDDDDPSPEQVRELDRELTAHGLVHEFHSYSGAGHGFLSEGRPIYRPEAAKTAWAEAVRWFRGRLA